MALRPALLLALLSLVALSGCSSKPAAADVGIHNFAYEPASVSIRVGQSVHWDNHDTTEHSITSDSGTTMDQDLGAGKGADVTFNTAGTYAYHCKYHTTMHGTVVVT